MMTYDEWRDTYSKHGMMNEAMASAAWKAAVAAERERWLRIAEAAQAVTTGSDDRIEIFRVPSHLMAALALALDEGPNVGVNRRA